MSRPERRRHYLWFVGLLAGLVLAYPAIAGPVVYMGARGWLPKAVCDAFFLPLWWVFATPAWGIVGDYLEWWARIATRPRNTLPYDTDLRIAIAAFALVAVSAVVYWSRTRPEFRTCRCAECGRISRVRSFRVYSRACPPTCLKCSDAHC